MWMSTWKTQYPVTSLQQSSRAVISVLHHGEILTEDEDSSPCGWEERTLELQSGVVFLFLHARSCAVLGKSVNCSWAFGSETFGFWTRRNTNQRFWPFGNMNPDVCVHMNLHFNGFWKFLGACLYQRPCHQNYLFVLMCVRSVYVYEHCGIFL